MFGQNREIESGRARSTEAGGGFLTGQDLRTPSRISGNQLPDVVFLSREHGSGDFAWNREGGESASQGNCENDGANDEV